MAKFDYKHAKEEIAQINAIVETCPDVVKEKCFELLFGAVFGKVTPREQPKPEDAIVAPKAEKEAAAEPPSGRKKLPPNVLSFARRHDITPDQLEKLFILDHEPMLSVYRIPGGNTARSQLYKVLLVLLENGLLNNQMSAPYSELRENLREDGLFDGNFNKMLKRHHELFKGAVSKNAITESGTVELTGNGQTKLAEIVKELAQA
jgi:hypothetical protein